VGDRGKTLTRLAALDTHSPALRESGRNAFNYELGGATLSQSRKRSGSETQDAGGPG